MRALGLLGRLRELLFPVDASKDPNLFQHYDPAAGGSQQLTEPARPVDPPTESVMAGCVRVLGLEAIKARLGVRGELSARHALAIATETLDRHLGPADIYQIVDQDTFQICFETSDLAAAQLLVEKVSTAIELRLRAEVSDSGNLSVETFVAPVPRADLQGGANTLTTLHQNLMKIRDTVQAKKREEKVISALRLATPVFQPLWCSRDSGETLNRCLLDPVSGSASLAHIEQINDVEELIDALAAVDCVLFARSIQSLHEALSEHKRAKILVPVHFYTISSQQLDFFQLAATVPVQYRRYMWLDIIGVPADASEMDLEDAVENAREVSDLVAVQVPPFDPRLSPKVAELIRGVSADISDDRLDNASSEEHLRRFAEVAALRGLRSLTYGANTIGKAAIAVSADFDYLGGSAVATTVSTPRPVARFNPLFGVDLPKLAKRTSSAAQRRHERFRPLDPNSTVTLADGREFPCRIPNLSASGAVVVCTHQPELNDVLTVGSLPAQVVRNNKRGFAVRFLKEQSRATVEAELHRGAGTRSYRNGRNSARATLASH